MLDYYVEQAGRRVANYFMIMTPIGDMTREELDYTLAAFSSEVIPAVRELETVGAPI